MSTLHSGPKKELDTPTQDALADEDRRRIIRLLRGRPGTVSERELADRLAATTVTSKSEDTTTLRTRLHHIHLPKLADCDLVDWNEQRGEVAATDHPVYDVDRADELLSDDGRDSIVPALADDRRREVLAVLEDESRSITRDELARKLASSRTDQPSARDVEDVNVRLHHCHLPRLERADLVEYDPDDGSVVYQGPPELMTVLPGNH